MLDTSDKTMVWLTREQAALFILFQGSYDKIGFMFKEGVFDIHQGSATLNFDKSGNLKSIKKELFSYAGVDNKDLV